MKTDKCSYSKELLWKQLCDELSLLLCATGLSLFIPYNLITFSSHDFWQYCFIVIAVLILLHKLAIRLKIFRNIWQVKLNKSTILIGVAGAFI